jgi:hypothetical protein
MFLLAEVGPFSDVDPTHASADTDSASVGGPSFGLSIYFSKAKNHKDKDKDVKVSSGQTGITGAAAAVAMHHRNAAALAARHHPSTDGVYENVFIAWDRSPDPTPLFLEIAWLVYAVAAARRKSGVPGCYPYYPYGIERPKPTRSAAIYNKTRKGYSSAKLRKLRKKVQGSQTGTGSVAETMTVIGDDAHDALSGAGTEDEDFDVNDED